MSAPSAIAAVASAVLALALGAALAPAASAADGDDQVVITGGLNVPVGETVGDVVVVDGPVRIAGHATGDVIAISGPLRVSGRIDGDAAAVSDRATLTSTARVGGDLLYGDERPVVANGAQVDGSISDKNWAETLSGWGWVSWFAWWLAVSVSTLLVGILLLALAPRALYAAERAARGHLGAAFGWGVLIAIALPIVAVLALVTLVGIPFGVGLLLALVPLMVVAYMTGAWIVGRRVVGDRGSAWLALLAGWGIVRVLALIPVAGAIVGLVITVLGLGALVVALWRIRRAPPETAPETPGHAAPA